MYLCWLGTFPESMVQQQQQQHRVSWVGGWGGWSEPLCGHSQRKVELGCVHKKKVPNIAIDQFL